MDLSTRRRPRPKLLVQPIPSQPRITIRTTRMVTTTKGRGMAMTMATITGTIINHSIRTTNDDMMGNA